MLSVEKNVKFHLSRRRGDRLNVMIVLERGDRNETLIAIGEGILMWFVLSVEELRLFHLSQCKANRFYAENVLQKVKISVF